ncbi:SWIM zinc finger family protein [Methanoregula sp.]|uniref:SWIM zinc finger family protein n=1 Tax=Methanoregula sp. TaxID=2052170 RepID=UPI0035627400
MKDDHIWERLGKTKNLDESLRSEIESAYGTRGKKALTILDAKKIKKYRDFFVAEGRTASYIVDEDFCTCGDFLYRGRPCSHILAVRMAELTGVYETVDSWYQDQLKNNPE